MDGPWALEWLGGGLAFWKMHPLDMCDLGQNRAGLEAGRQSTAKASLAAMLESVL